MRRTPLVLVVLITTLLLAGCSAGDDEASVEDAAVEVEAGDAEAGGGDESSGEEAAGGDDSAGVGGQDVDSQDTDGQDGLDGGEQDAGVGTTSSLPAAPPVAPGDRVIKEGTVTIEVDAGGFDQAYASVVAAARRLGGDVVASETRSNDEGATSGSVTVRVPVRAYEDLVVGVGDVGTVRGRSLDAQDVSAEYVDLESRLRHLEAQERFYLGLMEDAQGVEDAIAVQQRLDGIQGSIEEVEGRLRYLADRTSFSTLTVELLEVGAAPLAGTEPGVRPTLAGYWDTARDALVNVLGVLLVVAVFAAPLLAIAGLALLGWRAVERRRADASTASAATGGRAAPANPATQPSGTTPAHDSPTPDDEPVGAPPA